MKNSAFVTICVCFVCIRWVKRAPTATTTEKKIVEICNICAHDEFRFHTHVRHCVGDVALYRCPDFHVLYSKRKNMGARSDSLACNALSAAAAVAATKTKKCTPTQRRRLQRLREMASATRRDLWTEYEKGRKKTRGKSWNGRNYFVLFVDEAWAAWVLSKSAVATLASTPAAYCRISREAKCRVQSVSCFTKKRKKTVKYVDGVLCLSHSPTHGIWKSSIKDKSKHVATSAAYVL